MVLRLINFCERKVRNYTSEGSRTLYLKSKYNRGDHLQRQPPMTQRQSLIYLSSYISAFLVNCHKLWLGRGEWVEMRVGHKNVWTFQGWAIENSIFTGSYTLCISHLLFTFGLRCHQRASKRCNIKTNFHREDPQMALSTSPKPSNCICPGDCIFSQTKNLELPLFIETRNIS